MGTSRSKYDLYADSGSTQQNYRERRVLHVPCNSRHTSYVVHGTSYHAIFTVHGTSTSYHAILTSLVSSPASDGRQHGTRNFASQDFFAPKCRRLSHDALSSPPPPNSP